MKNLSVQKNSVEWEEELREKYGYFIRLEKNNCNNSEIFDATTMVVPGDNLITEMRYKNICFW